MIKQTLIVLGVILLALMGLVTWAVLQPPTKRPNVTVRLAGYTNDISGARLASFTVSNASPSTVRRLSHYQIQIPNATRWTTLSNVWVGGGSVLVGGTSETVTVPAATNQSWRVAFYVTPDLGIVHDVRRSIAQSARSAGLRTRYPAVNYGVHCDWIEDGQMTVTPTSAALLPR